MSVVTKHCELCELAPTTTRYAEVETPFRYAILDCDSCDVPMVVLGRHTARPSDEELATMHAALARVAAEKYGDDWFYDDHMRQIPDHYHGHARPLPAWLPKSLRRPAGGE